ncbi:hypothetical protein V6N11_073591 [Hibiscus sabdariffa]|uniref:Uncharacterized protein n=1 Tax=Hibiscus sabdariffa TaxID=183260 RepID=A0ABR2NTU5_9ROSI
MEKVKLDGLTIKAVENAVSDGTDGEVKEEGDDEGVNENGDEGLDREEEAQMGFNGGIEVLTYKRMVRRPMFDGGGGGAAMAGGGRDDCGRPNERLLSLYYTVFSWKNWL